MMKIIDIRHILVQAVEMLDNCDSDLNLKLESNTYFIKNSNAFLGVSGSDGGYLPLDKMKLSKLIAEAEEENDEEDGPPNVSALVEAFDNGDVDERDVRYWAKQKGWLSDPKIKSIIGSLNESISFEDIYNEAN